MDHVFFIFYVGKEEVDGSLWVDVYPTQSNAPKMWRGPNPNPNSNPNISVPLLPK